MKRRAGPSESLNRQLDLNAGERARFLEEACRGDVALRRVADSLLETLEEVTQVANEQTRLELSPNYAFARYNQSLTNALRNDGEQAEDGAVKRWP